MKELAVKILNLICNSSTKMIRKIMMQKKRRCDGREIRNCTNCMFIEQSYIIFILGTEESTTITSEVAHYVHRIK